MPGVREVSYWSVVTQTSGEREREGKRTHVMYDDFLYAIVYGIYIQCFHRVSVLSSSSQYIYFLREMGCRRAGDEGSSSTADESRTFSR